MQPLEIAQMIIPEEDSNAIIDTEDYTDEDDEPEEDYMKATAIDFVVGYLLQDMAFTEWFFNRNRWDEVEQKYDIERKKLAQPAHRQPITVDLAAMRKSSEAGFTNVSSNGVMPPAAAHFAIFESFQIIQSPFPLSHKSDTVCRRCLSLAHEQNYLSFSQYTCTGTILDI